MALVLTPASDQPRHGTQRDERAQSARFDVSVHDDMTVMRAVCAGNENPFRSDNLEGWAPIKQPALWREGVDAIDPHAYVTVDRRRHAAAAHIGRFNDAFAP
ncbi:MAG: hypothetical protein P4L90_11285 [Rhodopila sp.]|nr:hypothetical protein [Rhodopila sp.]